MNYEVIKMETYCNDCGKELINIELKPNFSTLNNKGYECVGCGKIYTYMHVLVPLSDHKTEKREYDEHGQSEFDGHGYPIRDCDKQ